MSDDLSETISSGSSDTIKTDKNPSWTSFLAAQVPLPLGFTEETPFFGKVYLNRLNLIGLPSDTTSITGGMRSAGCRLPSAGRH